MEVIISSIITGAITLCVCLVNNHYQSNETRNLIEYKLEELTKRVDKHNSVIERTYNLEKTVEVMEERIDVANHRINDLENK